jgi:hypothetical protein
VNVAQPPSDVTDVAPPRLSPLRAGLLRAAVAASLLALVGVPWLFAAGLPTAIAWVVGAAILSLALVPATLAERRPGARPAAVALIAAGWATLAFPLAVAQAAYAHTVLDRGLDAGLALVQTALRDGPALALLLAPSALLAGFPAGVHAYERTGPPGPANDPLEVVVAIIVLLAIISVIGILLTLPGVVFLEVVHRLSARLEARLAAPPRSP